MASGSIELVLGPMFAGKTSYLIERARQHKKEQVMAVRPIIDTREKGEPMLVSHDKDTFPAVYVPDLHTLVNLHPEQTGHKLIIIDEGQFFTDLKEGCLSLCKLGLVVIVGALNGMWNREPWPAISKLLPVVTNLTYLTASCSICQNKASFTYRTVKGGEDILIGAEESYCALCMDCYEKKK